MYGSEFAILGAAFIFIILAGVITVAVFYCLTLQRTLEAISPENRKMPPANVWLLFIPIFHWVWHFIIVNNLADSLKAEFEKRGVKPDEARPSYGIGLAASICWCTSWIPVLGSLTGLAALICWIIYWVKIAGYKNQLSISEIQNVGNIKKQTDILDNPNF